MLRAPRRRHKVLTDDGEFVQSVLLIECLRVKETKVDAERKASGDQYEE